MMKKRLFALLFATRITRLIAWLNRKKVTILCYHSVTKQQESNPNDPHKLHLRIESFLEQLDYLQAYNRIISLNEFVTARRENIKLPSGAAILTFDDGVRNFLTVVAPVLRERKIPATSFIITGDSFTQEISNQNGQWRPEDDDTYLSWTDVRQLTRQGMDFGSHSCTHRALPDIPAAEALNELETSLNILGSYLAPNIFALSYPHGRTSEAISQLSQSLGYSCAVTTALGQNNRNCDLFALKRIVIPSDDDLPTFAARLSGLTSWCGQVRELFTPDRSGRSNHGDIRYDPLVAEEVEI